MRVGHGDRDPGFQPGDDIEHSGAALLADRRAVRRRRIHRQGRPHLDRTRTEREVESRRGHTDDGERLAVEQDAGTDDRRIAPEVGAPQIVADDRHPRPRALIVGHERTPKRGLHTECVEEIPRDDLPGQVAGRSLPGEPERGVAIGDDVLEDVVLGAEIEERRIGHQRGVRRAPHIA